MTRQLTEGLRRLLTGLKLDYLLIDTHPGLQ
jgi:MinD-like ATPase involved in chromosome partitioning or flagellar assembly